MLHGISYSSLKLCHPDPQKKGNALIAGKMSSIMCNAAAGHEKRVGPYRTLPLSANGAIKLPARLIKKFNLYRYEKEYRYTLQSSVRFGGCRHFGFIFF
jgi:hypothetical protein